MQSILVTQNLDNTKKSKKAFRNLNIMNTKFDKLAQNISSIPKPSNTCESLKRDEINEVYEFTHQFDGSSGILALTFRENIRSYVQFVKDNLATENYLESRLITRIVKGLTGDAKFKYSQRQGDRFDSLSALYKWFDKEFQLSNLRSELHIKLKNWQIDPNIPILNIVQEYKRILNLFNLTETSSSQTILDLTQLSIPESINAIVKGLENTHPRVHKFIDDKFKIHLRMPDSFLHLENWIKDACTYIETSDRNSNKKQVDPTENNTPNTVLTNRFSDSNINRSRNYYSYSHRDFNNNKHYNWYSNDKRNFQNDARNSRKDYYNRNSINHQYNNRYQNQYMEYNNNSVDECNTSKSNNREFHYDNINHRNTQSDINSNNNRDQFDGDQNNYSNHDQFDHYDRQTNNEYGYDQNENYYENKANYEYDNSRNRNNHDDETNYDRDGNNNDNGTNYEYEYNQNENNHDEETNYEYGYDQDGNNYNNDTDNGYEYDCNENNHDSEVNYEHGYDQDGNSYDNGTNYNYDYGQNGNETNDDYGYEPNENNEFKQKRKRKQRSNATPKYKQFECDECGIWGHAYVDCYWIHRQFPHLVRKYASMKKLHYNNSNNKRNPTTHISTNDRNSNNEH